MVSKRFVACGKCIFNLIIGFHDCSDYTTQSDELRRQIDIEVKKGRDSFQLKENLCNAYIEEKNVEKVEELVKNYDFSDFIHHNIIKMHIEMSNTELALNHFNEIRETRPNFKLTRIEAARLARAMFMDEREWSEIIRIFTENKQMPLKGQNVSEIRYFLQKVAEAGNPAEFSELFDVLVATNFVVKDSHMAGFMIKVHLVNNDLPAAVRTFEKQFDERKFTANHVPLMKALITANDMDKLGKVFKLMRTKYSEGDAVLSLVTSFIQVGNISQARALLENNMSRISDHEFRNYCVRYCNYGEYPVLEGLLSATLGLEYDRSKIYSQLLGHFCDENKIDEALELWRRQCGENEEPTIEFLHTLASHLKKNNLSVPFPEPEATPQLSPLAFPEMRKALQKGDPVAALKSWEHINENHSLYTYYASDLVRLLAKNKRYTEAFDISIQTIEAERRVTDVALCDLNQRLAADGHSQLLEQLGEAVPRTTKRSIRFGCELLRAYEKNGKWDEFFNSTLEKRSRNANISERIPMINFLTLLRKQSIPLSQCKCDFSLSFLIMNANDFHSICFLNHFQLKNLRKKRLT